MNQENMKNRKKIFSYADIIVDILRSHQGPTTWLMGYCSSLRGPDEDTYILKDLFQSFLRGKVYDEYSWMADIDSFFSLMRDDPNKLSKEVAEELDKCSYHYLQHVEWGLSALIHAFRLRAREEERIFQSIAEELFTIANQVLLEKQKDSIKNPIKVKLSKMLHRRKRIRFIKEKLSKIKDLIEELKNSGYSTDL